MPQASQTTEAGSSRAQDAAGATFMARRRPNQMYTGLSPTGRQADAARAEERAAAAETKR
jgi:hypothetical protein